MADPKGVLVVPVGFRSDGSIHAFELDSSDRLKVVVDSISNNLTVVQSDPGQLFVTWGATSKGARGEGIAETVSNTALAAGTNSLDLTAVPANAVYVIKAISCRYVGTVATVILRLILTISGVQHHIKSFSPVLSNVMDVLTLDYPLQTGDNVRLQVLNATLNDDAIVSGFYEKLV